MSLPVVRTYDVRRARVDGLNEDLSALSARVDQLYDDLETAVEEIAAEAATDEGETRADDGQVGWEEIETASPGGGDDAESVGWTPSSQPLALISRR